MKAFSAVAAFSAKNAVAAEFFEFDGEVRGKVLELATDAAFGEPHQSTGDDAIVVFSAQLAEVISAPCPQREPWTKIL